ncbi:tetratricopeptide repeat protein [Marivirga sp. S37H4]|uniref:Tetratricopeptide repeat protein n=1 Tax=Marivirga aurantiaca TaxID=2802615 RepID=A0A934X0Q4_9BACT|nr:tetratricopeptide repeat protein [Marivirga aurantiaca]MBK6266539.1 tetratricopeptide repeat protein [Marivirga aurantiaca]
MKKWIFYIFLLINIPFAKAINDPTDSLLHLLEGTENETERTDILVKICRFNRNNDPEVMKYYADKLMKLTDNDITSISYAWGNYFMGEFYFIYDDFQLTESYYLTAFKVFNNLKNDAGIAESAYSLANIYFYRDRYRSSLNFAKTALDSYYNTENLLQQANILALICDIYTYMESYNQAIQYCIQSLRIKEGLDIKKGTEITLNTMGNIYQGLGTHQKAKEYLFNALEMARHNGEPYNIATTYSNIGNYYLSNNQNDSALSHFKKAMSIDSVSGDSSGLAYSYFDIAKVYRQQNEIKIAETYLSKAQTLATEQSMPELTARIGLELGDIYTDIEDFKKAITELKNSLAIAQRINSEGTLKDCYQKLAKYYDKVGDKDNALVYMRLYMLESEKKYRKENIKSIAEIETLYNIDKKEKEIDLLKKENDIKQLQAEQRKFFLIALSFGSFLLLILIIILYSRNKLKTRTNKALQIQNEAIQKQKAEIESQKEELGEKSEILEDKNKQITDSIIYARQIQESLLPSTKLIKHEFPKSFVYYKPKDIVSGDFYWNARVENKIAVAVVDCTGHGVPGAFMTVLANSLLNQIIVETGISSPDLVVSLLDQKIQQSLHQQQFGSLSTDGLDIGLLFLDLGKNTIEFTGAKIPLYIVSNGQLQTIKPDRNSVGSIQQSNKAFTKKQLKIEKESMIYMSTDGYQDQFGGPHDRKFMKPNFYNFLKSIYHLPPEEQEDKLERTFQQWRGTKPQTDDVLVLGIRI